MFRPTPLFGSAEWYPRISHLRYNVRDEFFQGWGAGDFREPAPSSAPKVIEPELQKSRLRAALQLRAVPAPHP